MNIEYYLLLDIETVPQQPGFAQLDKHGQQLWLEKAAQYPFPNGTTPEETYHRRAGILAEFGKVICISTGYFFRDKGKRLCLQVHTLYGHNEQQLLRTFVEQTSQFNQRKKIFEFAGHNIKEFDIPYLCRRLTVHRLALPEFMQLHTKKPWETQIFDTMNWWRFGDYKNYISLKLLTAVLGLPSAKEEMDGSRVQDVYYKEQNLAKIAEYCAGDVEAVARVLLAFRNDEDGLLSKILSGFTVL